MKTIHALPLAALTAVLLATGCKPNTDANKTTPPETTATAPTTPPPATPADSPSSNSTVGGAVSDATITTKVKAALAEDAGLKTLKLDVDTKDGMVTITGTVKAEDLKGNITSIAQKVEGVKSVDNKVEVKA